MILYRIEHKETKAGMWHNYDGSYNGIIKTLTEGKSKNVPMNKIKEQSKDGKKWFSSVSNLDQLLEWFSRKDIEELVSLGYQLYEIECSECNRVAKGEILFTRESVTSMKEISLTDMVEYETEVKC